MTFTTSPGAAIGTDADVLPRKATLEETGIMHQITTVERLVGTFAENGITASLLVQLQHIQELAIAIQLQGKHLVHLDLFGYMAGEMDLTLAGCPSDQHWKATAQRMPSRCISIPRQGSPEAIRKVQAELADAIADLMALLEEPQP